jgi:leucyl aminopeptidase
MKGSEMQLKLVRANLSAVKTDVLVLFEAEGQRRPGLESLSALYDSGEIKGKLLEFTLLHGVAGYAATRVLVAGSGKAENRDAATVKKAVSAAVRFLKGKGVGDVSVALDADLANPANAAAVAEGVLVGAWEPDRLKTDTDRPAPITLVNVIVPETAAADLETALQRGEIVGQALNLTRNIAVEPPNVLTPMALAERARAVANECGLSIDVLDQDRMRQLGMGALLGVAQGSAEPPAMIVIHYTPAKATAGGHLALIGKGVTFDTGGISIKPADGMEKMKYDMAGGAAVIGAMQAISKLKPGVAVTGIVPTVENMPGGKAQRPGDIVKSLSGKTIEVLNTDAEGRLILADAITYAKQLGCTHLVDAATLTGAIVVALGHTSSGVYTNDDELFNRWMAAGRNSGEKMWHMPLDDDYLEQLKCVYADLQNIGTRWGGACTAAAFLREFAGDTPWVHVDVAGTAWLDDAKPYMAKGPTGVPLASFVDLAMNWK